MTLAPVTHPDPVPRTGDPKPPTATPFVVPDGGLPPWEVYEAFEYTRKTSRYQREHVPELAGKHVAWAFGGSFLYAAPTPEELLAALAHVSRDSYITGYIDPEPEVVVPRNASLSRAS